jgi:hypothetical protein
MTLPMSRQRRLKGVVANILGSFVSRNNDVGGYWAIGKLYEHARQHQTQNVLIDLATREILPTSLELGSMVAKYSSLFAEHLARIRVRLDSLSSARIQLAFDNAVTDLRPPSGMPGMPFRCMLEVVDGSKGVLTASHVGVARPHDPRRESRSARPDARS